MLAALRGVVQEVHVHRDAGETGDSRHVRDMADPLDVVALTDCHAEPAVGVAGLGDLALWIASQAPREGALDIVHAIAPLGCDHKPVPTAGCQDVGQMCPAMKNGETLAAPTTYAPPGGGVGQIGAGFPVTPTRAREQR